MNLTTIPLKESISLFNDSIWSIFPNWDNYTNLRTSKKKAKQLYNTLTSTEKEFNHEDKHHPFEKLETIQLLTIYLASKEEDRYTQIDQGVDILLNLLIKKGFVPLDNLVSKERNPHFKYFNDEQIKMIICVAIYKIGIMFRDEKLYDTDFVEIGKRITPHELFQQMITPSYSTAGKNYAKIDSTYFKIVKPTEFPIRAEPGWLDPLYNLKIPWGVRMNLKKLKNKYFRRALNNDIAFFEKALDDEANKPKDKQNLRYLQNKITQKVQALNDLDFNKTKYFESDLYFYSRGSSEKELFENDRLLRSALDSAGIEVEQYSAYQSDLVKSILPAGKKTYGKKEYIPADALGNSLFINSYKTPIDPQGVPLGFTVRENKLVSVDVWKLSRFITLQIGDSGGGKSYSEKVVQKLENLINGTQIIVIDPQGEYVSYILENKGVVIDFDPNINNKNIPNIFHLFGLTLDQKLVHIESIIKSLIPSITPAQWRLLRPAIRRLYDDKGFKRNDPSTWIEKKTPTLGDLHELLKKLKKDEIKKPSGQRSKDTITSYDILIFELDDFVNGIHRYMNNKDFTFDLSNQWIAFNYSKVPDRTQPVLMLLTMQYCLNILGKDIHKKIRISVDEAWKVLRDNYVASVLAEIARTARKFGKMLSLQTQGLSEFINSPYGPEILNQCSVINIFRIARNSLLQQVRSEFTLNDEQTRLVHNLPIGESIMILDAKEKLHVKMKVPKNIHNLITTNVEELAQIDKQKAESMEAILKKKQRDLQTMYFDEIIMRPQDPYQEKFTHFEDQQDLEKSRIIDKPNITPQERAKLLSNGYEEIRTFEIGTGTRLKNIYIKPHAKESAKHMELVYAEKNYLKNKGVPADQIREPLLQEAGKDPLSDLDFSIGSHRIIIENETGTMLSNPKEFHRKIKYNNETYGQDNWVFVLADTKKVGDNPKKMQKYLSYHPHVYSRKSVAKYLDPIIEDGLKEEKEQNKPIPQ